jgi:hypothetical protein
VGWGNSSSKAFGISFADRPKAKNDPMYHFQTAMATEYILMEAWLTAPKVL